MHAALRLALLLSFVPVAACGGGARATPTTEGETTGSEEGTAEREEEASEEFPLEAAVRVPGTGITMRAPRGSDLLPIGAGFVHTRRRIQIIVAETVGSREMLRSFRDQLLGDAENEVDPETIALGEAEGTLGIDRQEQGDVELERVWLFAREGDRAVVVIGLYESDRSERYRGLVRASVMSAAWDRTVPIDPEQALGVGLTVEGLVLDRNTSSPVVYALEGAAVPPTPSEPRLFVMSLPVVIAASERAEVCEPLLLQAGPVQEESIRERHDIETDTISGCEIEGLQENEDPDEGEPTSAMTYAAVVFNDAGVFLVAGIVDAAQRDTWIERFREATRSLHGVRTED